MVSKRAEEGDENGEFWGFVFVFWFFGFDWGVLGLGVSCWID